MLTRKLLQHTLVFLCSIGVTKAILWLIDNYRVYAIARDIVYLLQVFGVAFLLVGMMAVIITIVFAAVDGRLDNYFRERTDPIIQKIINFFNRRNNIE